MNCAAAQERLSAYIDGELSQFEHAQVAMHVRRCAPCAAELQVLRHTVVLLSDLPEVSPPAGFRSGLRARLESLPPPIPVVTPQRRPARQPVWKRWGLPAAAAAAAIGGFLITYRPVVDWPMVEWHGPDAIAPAPPSARPSAPPVAILPKVSAPAQPTIKAGGDSGDPAVFSPVTPAVQPDPGNTPPGTAAAGTPEQPAVGSLQPIGRPRITDAGASQVPTPDKGSIDPARAAAVAAAGPDVGSSQSELYHLQYSLGLKVADLSGAVAQLERVSASAGGKVVLNRPVLRDGDTWTEVTLELPSADIDGILERLAAVGQVVGTPGLPQRFDRGPQLTQRELEVAQFEQQEQQLQERLADPSAPANLRAVDESDLTRTRAQLADLRWEIDHLRLSNQTVTVVIALQ